MKKRMRKVLIVFLCLTVLIQNFPLAAFAAAEDNTCEHHITHTAECGYAEAVEGADCTHVHDSECGYAEAVAEVKCTCESTDENGALIHTEGCGYVAGKAGSDCTHAHDAACGYVKAVEGHECNFECAECSAAEITEPVQDSQKMLLSDNPYDDFYDEIDKPNPDVDSDPFKSVTVYFALNLVDGNNVPIDSDYTVNGKSDTANTTASAVTVTFEADIADNVTDEYSYWKDDAITLIIPKIRGYVTPGTVTFDWYFNHITESEYLKTESGEKVASEKNFDGLDIGYYNYTIQLAPCTHEALENGVCTVCGVNNAAVQLTRGETVTYYTDLASAAADINLTPSGTTAKVKLLKNSTVAGRVDLMPSALELDLNGCTVTYTGSLSNDTMLSLNNTSAVICDSSAEKNGMINGNGLARVTIYGSSVEMRSGTITGKEPIWLYSSAAFTLTGGKIRADGTGRGEACIHPYASSTAVYINGGTLEGAYGVHAENGAVFVSGNPTFSVESAEAFLKENGIIDLTDMTDPDGFVTELNKDIAKPYDSILIPAGYRIYNGETMMENTAPQAYAFLTVKAHTDHTSTGDNIATCTDKAVCDVCGLSYGPEPAGHSTSLDGDRFATCVEKAYCSVCDSEYGELASDNHDYEWTYDGTYHRQVCIRDESHMTEKCGSEFYHSYMMGDGGVIEVTQRCGDCGYSGEYAEVYLSGSSFTYTGEAIEPHVIDYPDDWLDEQNIKPTYENNVNVTTDARMILSERSLSFAITAREVTKPSFEGLKEKYVYTGEAVKPSFTLKDDLGNVIPADEYTVTYSDNTDAGIATITVTDVSGGNYIVSGSISFQIAEHIHEFTFTADGVTITAVCANTDGACPDTEQSVTLVVESGSYTGDPCFGYYDGSIDGQTVTLHYTADSGYDSENPPVDADTYSLTMTVGEKSVSKSFTISPMNIAKCNPVLNQNSFTYNGTAPELTVTAVNGSVGWTNLKPGDDFTVSDVEVNAGNHKLTVTGIGNYSGTVELDYSIAPVAITVTANEHSKTYGDADPVLTYTVTGLMSGDELSGALTRDPGEDANTYAITQGTLTAGDNYTITYNGADFTVNKRNITITANDQTIPFGTEISDTEITAVGLADGHSLTVTLTPSTANVTVDGTITAGGAVITAGSDDVTANYEIGYAGGKLVIEPDTSKIDGLTTENVTSANEADIKAVQDMLQNADSTKPEWAEIIENCEALLDAVEAAQDAAATENTEKVEDITADNVKPEDKEALEDAKADLEKALTDHSGNYTEEETKAIEEEIQRIGDAIESLEKVEDVTETITRLPETLEPDDEETAGKILDAKEAYDGLTDYEKSLVDETVRNKLERLVAALPVYEIIKGNGSKWTNGSSSGLSFTANGPFGKFVGIEVDGKKVDAKYYDAREGSTVITLKQSFLRQLSVGDHTITVLYTDGETSGSFGVLAAAFGPSTGDDSDIILPAAMFVVSFAVMTVILTVSEKRKREN